MDLKEKLKNTSPFVIVGVSFAVILVMYLLFGAVSYKRRF